MILVVLGASESVNDYRVASRVAVGPYRNVGGIGVRQEVGVTAAHNEIKPILKLPENRPFCLSYHISIRQFHPLLVVDCKGDVVVFECE